MRRLVFWGGFALFVCIALVTQWSDTLLKFDDSKGLVRAGLIVIWLSFTAYSLYCIARESLLQTATDILRLYWGRQVGADLYISVLMSIGLVYLVTSSVTETLLWSIAFIPFANLAILLFIILRLEDILSAFGLG